MPGFGLLRASESSEPAALDESTCHLWFLPFWNSPGHLVFAVVLGSKSQAAPDIEGIQCLSEEQFRDLWLAADGGETPEVPLEPLGWDNSMVIDSHLDVDRTWII